MFVDFNRVFSGKPQTELKVPDAMVEHLSSQLPLGVRYRATDDGNCEIIADGESVNVGGLVLVPTDEQKKVLGKKFTFDDVLKYSYNAQKPIPMKLKKDGYIILNGQEIPIERIHYNPYNPVKIVSGKLFMYPHQFSEPFSLSIGCEKYSRQLIFKRVPYESVNIAAFESQSEQPLMVKYLVDEDERRIDFNISFNLSYANTVRDIVESTSIYNAFAEGKGLFGGKPLITDIDVSKVKKYDPESLLFWEKVLIIEERLNVGFEPPQEDVDFKTICLMETLYQNLIKGVPIRENKKVDVLKGEQVKGDNDQIKTSVGESVFFEFQASTHISLLGVEIDLPCVVAICDSKITNYTVEDKKYKLSLDHLSEDKHMYTSTLLFENEEALLAYMNESRDERIAALCNAKTVQEYLTDQQSNK